jgi:hypothetical protein
LCRMRRGEGGAAGEVMAGVGARLRRVLLSAIGASFRES